MILGGCVAVAGRVVWLIACCGHMARSLSLSHVAISVQCEERGHWPVSRHHPGHFHQRHSDTRNHRDTLGTRGTRSWPLVVKGG